MSALARFFAKQNLFVAGYDSTSTELTQQLENEGMLIHFQDSVELIPKQVLTNKNKTLVIYTPAVPENHQELTYLIENGFEVQKRAQALGTITANYQTAAVAGTHGKTSTSTLLTHILSYTPEKCIAFLGGISKNFESNLVLNNSSRLVVEADEYDRSFLWLSPQLAIITSADADHLDIFGSHKEVEKAFSDFISKIQPKSTLIIKRGLEHLINRDTQLNVFSYSLTEKADYYAENIRTENGVTRFTLNTPTYSIENIELGVPGNFNVENAIAASAAALAWGTSVDNLRITLKSFLGVQRRFDMQFKGNKTIYIDDYAHHPEEIRAAVESARSIFPNKKITGIFQPHLFSRTQSLGKDIANSLSLLDNVLLLDIYPAREEPIPGITSEYIFKDIVANEKKLCTLSTVLQEVQHLETDILISMGAGNISTLVNPIVSILKQKEGQ